MARLQINQVAIRGVAVSVPDHPVPLDTEHCPFSEEDLQKIRSMTGIHSRFTAPDGMCASDLMLNSAREMLQILDWDPQSIELLVVVTQSGDYILPATACVLQHKLGLPKACLAFDIGLGCSGYVYGLSVVGSLLNGTTIKRALLLTGDTSSRMANPKDRTTALLFGDVGAATALEYCEESKQPWFFVGGTDGSGVPHLKIDKGGTRHSYLAPMQDSADPYLFMDGGEIFKFTIEVVPRLIRETLDFANATSDQVDFFLMHQANLFLLQHLAKKLKIPAPKMPTTLQEFGNSSSSSIPLTLVHGIANQLEDRDANLLLAGFGVGFSWGALYLQSRARLFTRLSFVR